MSTPPDTDLSPLAGIEVEPVSRSAFLVRGALATASVYGLAAVGPTVGRALAQGREGDIDILNFALTLEYLEQDFYDTAVRELDLTSKVKNISEHLGDNEQEHVANLRTTVEGLGGKPADKPTFRFPFEDEEGFLELAEVFEETGLYAYNGAAPQIESKDILAAAGAIVQVEGRHAAVIRLARGNEPTVGAFDKTLDRAAVDKAVKPYIV